MRSIRVVVVVAMVGLAGLGGGSGCFSTARYDDAHAQRVASINARYEVETVREQQHQAALVAVIEGDRALLIPTRPTWPTRPGSRSSPLHRVDEREDILECRNQCERCGLDESLDGTHPNDQARSQCLHEICEPAYVDALTKTYSQADIRWVTSQLAISEDAELETLLAFSHNQAVTRRIEDEARNLAQRQAWTRQRLEQERQAAIGASAQRRNTEIGSGRAAHRARVQAAAFAAREPGPVVTRPSGLCVTADPGLSLVSGCPDRGSSPHRARVSGED